jgi:hypothetical protein
MASIPASPNHEMVWFSFLTKDFQSLSHESNRLVPGDLLPIPFTPLSLSSQWMPNSIGIIEDLKPSLTFRAESTPVDGIIFYSLQFDRPMIDRSDSKATTTWALEADTG